MIKLNCNFNNHNNNKNIDLETTNAWSNPSDKWVIIMCLLLLLMRPQFRKRIGWKGIWEVSEYELWLWSGSSVSKQYTWKQ